MSKQTDISKQIQKYLNGELDAKAMHQLEREALNDQFLADALEGYAGAKTNQQDNLSDIAGRLQNRTNTKVKRLIPWKLISVAASVIVVLTIGGLWMYNGSEQPQVQPEKVAMLDKAEVVKPDTQSIAQAPAPVAEKEEISTPPVAEQRVAAVRITSGIKKADVSANIQIDQQVAASKARQKLSKAQQIEIPPSLDISENANAGYTPGLRKDSVALEDRIVNGFFNTDADKPQAVAAARPVEQALKGRVEGVSVTKIGKSIMPNQFIDGRVMDNGIPLPGVTVTVKGTGAMAQTDANGKFKIPAAKENTELEVSYLGYLSQSVAVKEHDSLLIAMQPSNQALNEVVVVGYGTKKRISKALPVIGWKEYKKYLNENATSPDGKKGTVKLSFTVSMEGKVEDFKILNGISAKTDAAAIELVKNGSNWQPNTNGKPEVVTISIKFVQ
ncbi:MAG: TonB family protein [Sphingobacteriaceae bacterium]|nr:MAG: TonB family protein [Sphingobacteriaceae bacterium]